MVNHKIRTVSHGYDIFCEYFFYWIGALLTAFIHVAYDITVVLLFFSYRKHPQQTTLFWFLLNLAGDLWGKWGFVDGIYFKDLYVDDVAALYVGIGFAYILGMAVYMCSV